MKTAVIFGAGAVGRGFMAQVLSASGYEIYFVDANPALVSLIEAQREYTQVTVDSSGEEPRIIAPVRAIMADDFEAIRHAFANADIAVTSVGMGALPDVCRTIGRCLKSRISAGASPLDLLIAENMNDAQHVVRGLILAGEPDLSGEELDANLGLVSTSIGRMIPVSPPGTVTTTVRVEPYDFLPLDGSASRAPLPNTEHFIVDASVPFEYYLDRKLYIHNMGHAMCAYLGQIAHDTYIWESVGRIDVRYFVRAAMVESASAIAAKYDKPVGPLLEHIDDLLFRFSNRRLGDTVDRVGRDPVRKLAAKDRFRGAIALCYDMDIPTTSITLGLAAAVHCAMENPSLATALDPLLHEITQTLRPTDAHIFEAQLDQLATGFDAAAQIGILQQVYETPRVP